MMMATNDDGTSSGGDGACDWTLIVIMAMAMAMAMMVR